MEKPNNINAILEGCNHDFPYSLQYCLLETAIPENAQILLSDHEHNPHRYLLYAKTEDFSKFKILQNPHFKRNLNFKDPNKLFSGGWPLRNFEPNFRWIFDVQRSLTTRDGRIYIQATYFVEGFRRYLDNVPEILKDCADFYLRRKTTDELA